MKPMENSNLVTNITKNKFFPALPPVFFSFTRIIEYRQFLTSKARKKWEP